MKGRVESRVWSGETRNFKPRAGPKPPVSVSRSKRHSGGSKRAGCMKRIQLAKSKRWRRRAEGRRADGAELKEKGHGGSTNNTKELNKPSLSEEAFRHLLDV